MQHTVRTTDEMDSTTPEERYSLVAICSHCHEPHYFTGSKERSSQTAGEVCEHCKGTQFYGMQSRLRLTLQRQNEKDVLADGSRLLRYNRNKGVLGIWQNQNN